jgi:ADP-heptose:LPS heptosyltransferase
MNVWHRFLLRSLVFYLNRKVRRRPPQPLADLDLRRVRRLLLINSTAMGDLLLSTPAIRALKETYPHWQLDLLVHPRNRDLVAHNPRISRLWLYPGRGVKLFRLMREIRRQHYDAVLILHGNDPEASLVAWSAGTPFIVGSGRSPFAFAYAARVSSQDSYRHAIERRLDLVRVLMADTNTREMEVFLPSQEVSRAGDFLGRHFGDRPGVLMALHPTGSGTYKWWPLERFAALGHYLYQQYGAALLIISGSKDRQVAEALAAQLPGPNLVTGGRYPLLTVAGFLKHCRLLVANDSGPMHLGLALKVPTLALIGGDHPARIGPYQVKWGRALCKREEVCESEECLKTRKCQNNRCMQAIDLQEVINTLKTWWEPRWWKGNRL